MKELLAHNLTTFRSQCVQLDQKLKKEADNAGSQQLKAKKRAISHISNYGWDQSDKFMKIYVTVKAVHNLDKSNVSSLFTES